VLETTYFDTVVEVVADAGGVVGLLGPVAAHLLERDPSEQDGVGGLALLAQRRDEVGLVDLGLVGHAEPAIGGVDDAVERDVLGDDQIACHWVS
jgi:hypothetical protein